MNILQINILKNKNKYLQIKSIKEISTKKVNDIIKKLKEKSDLQEDLKDSDPLHWIGTMNAIKEQAEKIAYNEIIYK